MYRFLQIIYNNRNYIFHKSMHDANQFVTKHLVVGGSSDFNSWVENDFSNDCFSLCVVVS